MDLWLNKHSVFKHRNLVADVIGCVQTESRGTGQGYGGFGPKWTKEVKKEYNFEYKLQAKSISTKKHSGCIVTLIKNKTVLYENGKRVSTSVKHGNQNRIVKEKKKK